MSLLGSTLISFFANSSSAKDVLSETGTTTTTTTTTTTRNQTARDQTAFVTRTAYYVLLLRLHLPVQQLIKCALRLARLLLSQLRPLLLPPQPPSTFTTTTTPLPTTTTTDTHRHTHTQTHTEIHTQTHTDTHRHAHTHKGKK